MCYTLIGTIRIFGLISIFSGCAVGCSGLTRSEEEKIRRQNCKGEYIYRAQSDVFYPIATPEHRPKAAYPWENEGHLPRITKEFFRCKGNPLNPPYAEHADSEKPIADCEGGSNHGLPILAKKENVYPALLDLLNYLQKKTKRRVIITCGHRCPAHNSYADSAKANRYSKHQIGAEVDFYVQGMEDQPLEVVSLLFQYYREHPTYQHSKEWVQFQRYENPDARVAMQPWFNKEIWIELHGKGEGRDFDNRHPYPYITIQLRFDRNEKKQILFNWEQATKGYVRG